MFRRHKNKKPVRNYLLGTLDECGAASLEEKCFTDSAFFQWVRQVEEELIADYLQGRLAQDSKERFERRYLVVPELQRRLEAVRSRTPVRPGASFRVHWRFVLAATVLACCAASPWLFRRTLPVRPIETTPEVALIDVNLAPGLAKGAGSSQVEFALPARGKVRLSMELPGRAAPIDCRVALTVVTSDSRREPAWTSQPVRSQAVGGSQEVRVELDSSALRPADYVAEAIAAGGVLETYPFRVNRAISPGSQP